MKTVLALLLLGVAGFIMSRVFPPYFANSQLADKIKNEAKFAQPNDRTVDQVRASVLRSALLLELPLTSDNLHVEMGPSGTHITADYDVTVDLYYHQVDWAFHISASGE
jgi:hypothetical protein